MEPADDLTFRNELAACLALVAPVGMTEEAKADWLTVAWETLRHLPADLLRSGCVEARKSCDHPAKIVPAIVAATRDSLASRHRASEWDAPRTALPKPDYCTAAEAAEILRQFGLPSISQRGDA